MSPSPTAAAPATRSSSSRRAEQAAERQPLLAGRGGGEQEVPAGELRREVRTATPLPTKQVLVLCLMRFGEPIAFTLIFPFVARFVEDLHVAGDPKKIGYYAGLIESLFALTTFTTVLFWGRLSDRIGRKPVLIIGLLGVTASILAFGLSTAFWMLVVSRCIGGALNGNVAVIKSTLGELTDESNQGRAFSFLPMAWSLGSVIGPLLGGYLSHPATTYPLSLLFSHSTFFLTYPYFLPCLIGALFPLCGAIVGFFFLEETLTPAAAAKEEEESRARRRHERFVKTTSSTVPAPGSVGRRRLADGREEDEPDSGYSTPARRESVEGREGESAKPAPRFADLFTPRVWAALITYALLALETVSLDALLILFAYTPVAVGGLGFPPSSIGTALSLSGLFAVSFQLLLFPPLQCYFGTVRLYRILMALWPIVFALFPVMGWFAKQGSEAGVWGAMGLFLGLKSFANMSYATNMLTLTDAAPSKRLLGTLNGVAQMGSSLMRSIGPFCSSALFAFSISHPSILGGQLVFLVMILLAIGGAASAQYLQEGGRASAVVEVEDE